MTQRQRFTGILVSSVLMAGAMVGSHTLASPARASDAAGSPGATVRGSSGAVNPLGPVLSVTAGENATATLSNQFGERQIGFLDSGCTAPQRSAATPVCRGDAIGKVIHPPWLRVSSGSVIRLGGQTSDLRANLWIVSTATRPVLTPEGLLPIGTLSFLQTQGLRLRNGALLVDTRPGRYTLEIDWNGHSRYFAIEVA